MAQACPVVSTRTALPPASSGRPPGRPVRERPGVGISTAPCYHVAGLHATGWVRRKVKLSTPDAGCRAVARPARGGRPVRGAVPALASARDGGGCPESSPAWVEILVDSGPAAITMKPELRLARDTIRARRQEAQSARLGAARNIAELRTSDAMCRAACPPAAFILPIRIARPDTRFTRRRYTPIVG